MSNDKESNDFELEDLEKPLTEQKMKETIGGSTPGVQVPVITPVPVLQSGGTSNFTAG